jgi:OmpA-OmpF porin, OOP family
MQKSRYPMLIALTFALVATTTQVQSATDEGWYGGLSLGASRIKLADDFLSYPGATGQSLSKDETGTAYKLFAGYRLKRNFALEGGYTDFGSFSATNNIAAIALFGPGSLAVKLKSSGFHLDAVGIVPVGNKFELFGKLGVILTTTKATFAGSGSVQISFPGTPPSSKHSDLNLKAGIGAEYHLSGPLGLRLEGEQAFGVGDANTTGKGDIRVFSLGLNYRF